MTVSLQDVRLVHELIASAIVGGESYAEARRALAERLELNPSDEMALAVSAALARFCEDVRTAELGGYLNVAPVASLDEHRAKRAAA